MATPLDPTAALLGVVERLSRSALPARMAEEFIALGVPHSPRRLVEERARAKADGERREEERRAGHIARFRDLAVRYGLSAGEARDVLCGLGDEDAKCEAWRIKEAHRKAVAIRDEEDRILREAEKIAAQRSTAALERLKAEQEAE